jgi:hypothetical protein
MDISNNNCYESMEHRMKQAIHLHSAEEGPFDFTDINLLQHKERTQTD